MTNKYTPAESSMIRLLEKDNMSPSGWRISGYLLTLSYPAYNISGVYFSKVLKPYNPIGGLFDNWRRIDELLDTISFDAFDPGILMPDGTWWFNGDAVKETIGWERAGILTHRSYSGDFTVIRDDGRSVSEFFPSSWKRIGTVHEKEE